MTDTSKPPANAGRADRLDTPEAGRLVIRGGAIRSAGYVFGLALGLVAVPLLARHLGVVDFGRYVLVTSLIAIVGILADGGLTTVGVREYAVRDVGRRRLLMHNLMAARIVAATVAGAAAVLFAAAVGYGGVIVAGTALGAFGLVFTMVQQTYVIALTAELRLGLATALDVVRQAFHVVGIVVLVLAGAGLLAFFVLPVPLGIAIVVLTILSVRDYRVIRPRVDREEWRYLFPEAVPAAAASVLASLFYRVAIVMMSLIASATATGYFAASFRVVEALVAVPSLLVGSAYPVLARAAETDTTRLVNAFQRLFEVSLILAVWVALALAAGAEPVIDVVAGPDFEPAVPVLQIQGMALAATFFVALFGGTLWVVRAKRQLVVGNVVGVGAAIALTGALVPIAEAKGAAVAMVCAEALLAAWLGMALLRPRRELRPSLAVLPKVMVAGAAAAALLLAPLADIVAVGALTAVYFVVLALLRGIPAEVSQALRRLPTR